MTPGELLAECGNILLGQLSPEDLAIRIACLVKNRGRIPCPRKVMAHLRDERVRKLQGKYPALTLAVMSKCEQTTVYRAFGQICKKRQTCK